MKKIKRSQEFQCKDLVTWYRTNSNTDYDREKQTNNSNVKNLIRNSLLLMKNNLCAYTEMLITDAAEIDHWNPKLKHTDGYEFSNLFAVHSAPNKTKSNLTPPIHLKPDEDDYSPEKYLDYDIIKDLFIPKNDLNDEFKIVIQNEIDILGINSILSTRKSRLGSVKSFANVSKIKGLTLEVLFQTFPDFPTAKKFFLSKFN